MADERYDPFANAVVYGPDGQRETLSAVADTPATSVAEPAEPPEPVEPEPEELPSPEEPSEPPRPAPEPSEEEEQPAETIAQSAKREKAAQRFADLAKERNEYRSKHDQAMGQVEALRQELDFYRQQALHAPRPPDQSPPVQDGLQRTAEGRPLRPTEDAYATTQDYHQALQTYEDALGTWHGQQALQRYEAERTEREATARVLERYPDFYQVVQRSRVPVNPHISAALNASPDKPALLYHLATHPDEAIALTNTYGPAAFMAIGALQERLKGQGMHAPAGVPSVPANGAGEPPQPPPAAPPPPITPTRATGARAPRTYDEMGFLEFYDTRNKEEQARRR